MTGPSSSGQAEAAVIEARLLDLRGASDEAYRDFLGEVAAGALADLMLPAGDAVVEFWRSEAGRDGELSEDAAVRLAEVAINLLRRERSAGAWNAFPELRYWSRAVSDALDGALGRLLWSDEDFSAWFMGFVEDLVDEAATDPVARARPWDSRTLGPMLARWRESPDLNVLWGGLRTWHANWFHDDPVHSALTTVARERPETLPGYFVRFGDPHSTISALQWVGVGRRFHLWRHLMEQTPPCFGPDGTWLGNALLPLLLSLGLEALRDRPYSLDDRELEKPDLRPIIAAVADAVVARPDAVPLCSRWGAWLAMKAIRRGSGAGRRPGEEDLELDLLVALTCRVSPSAWVADLPGAPAAETWCRRVAATLAALDGRGPVPGSGDLVAAWEFTPEGWIGADGERLKELATGFTMDEEWPQGRGSGLLGIPFALVPNGGATWHDLWRRTATLREILEFGDVSSSGRRSPHEAHELLRLAFALGLAALDRIVAWGRDNGDPTVPASALLADLLEATCEMEAIDGVNPIAWTGAARHLAIRRGRWSLPPLIGETRTVMLGDDREPTLATFLRRVAGDAVEVVQLVADLRRNGVGDDLVRRAVSEAGVDLSQAVTAVERLATTDPGRGQLLDTAADVRGLC